MTNVPYSFANDSEFASMNYNFRPGDGIDENHPDLISKSSSCGLSNYPFVSFPFHPSYNMEGMNFSVGGELITNLPQYGIPRSLLHPIDDPRGQFPSNRLLWTTRCDFQHDPKEELALQENIMIDMHNDFGANEPFPSMKMNMMKKIKPVKSAVRPLSITPPSPHAVQQKAKLWNEEMVCNFFFYLSN